MIELTQEQAKELPAGEAVEVHSPDGAVYYLVAADAYERMKAVLEEIDPSLYEFEDIQLDES